MLILLLLRLVLGSSRRLHGLLPDRRSQLRDSVFQLADLRFNGGAIGAIGIFRGQQFLAVINQLAGGDVAAEVRGCAAGSPGRIGILENHDGIARADKNLVKLHSVRVWTLISWIATLFVPLTIPTQTPVVD